jgi:hypothetical protein
MMTIMTKYTFFGSCESTNQYTWCSSGYWRKILSSWARVPFLTLIHTMFSRPEHRPSLTRANNVPLLPMRYSVVAALVQQPSQAAGQDPEAPLPRLRPSRRSARGDQQKNGPGSFDLRPAPGDLRLFRNAEAGDLARPDLHPPPLPGQRPERSRFRGGRGGRLGGRHRGESGSHSEGRRLQGIAEIGRSRRRRIPTRHCSL